MKQSFKTLLFVVVCLLTSALMSSCSTIGRGLYAYKLKKGRDSLEKKFPKIRLSLVATKDGYRLLSRKTGLVKSFILVPLSSGGDTVSVFLTPDYDYIEQTLYEFGISQAEKAQKNGKKGREAKKR